MKNFIQEQHKVDCIEAIKTLISYPSYLREDHQGKTPFGDDIQAVLEKNTYNLRKLRYEIFY